jgi:hypothetical protein
VPAISSQSRSIQGSLSQKIDELLRASAANPTARRCRCILDFGGLMGFSLGESLLEPVIE